MRILLTNLSNKLYEASRFRLNESALRFGVDEVRSFDFEELRPTAFYAENKEILDQPGGLGYWLWKPYIVLEALRSVPDNSIVVYSDSGIEIMASLDPLLWICEKEAPILLFGNGDQVNSMWTKRDCFILMGCDTEYYWRSPQCDAAFAIFRKCALSLNFVEEWLQYCRDVRILTDLPNTCGKRDLPDFVQHRRDQSVLSLMVQKHRLPLYRIPTQFGNHYKTHSYRVAAEFNCVNQYKQLQVNYYSVIPYYNSPYFQLLDHHRAKDNVEGCDKEKFALCCPGIEKKDQAAGEYHFLMEENDEHPLHHDNNAYVTG